MVILMKIIGGFGACSFGLSLEVRTLTFCGLENAFTGRKVKVDTSFTVDSLETVVSRRKVSR